MFEDINYRRLGVCIFIMLIPTGVLFVHKIWYPVCRFSPSVCHVSFSPLPYNQTTVTIVTAYFPLNKAKRSQSKYLEWLENLFSFCQSPMVIFTSAEFYPTLYRLRRNGSLPSFFITNYSSPLQMPPIQPLISTFKKQHRTDPERSYHSVDLYGVWCAKSFMLNRSAELNPFRSQFFVYADAGAFRSSNYRFQAWPDDSALTALLQNDRFLLGMIQPLPRRFCSLRYKSEDGPFSMDLIEGTFMGGSSSAVRWWTSVFYQTIDDYRRRGFFIGKDQSVLNAMALVYASRLQMLLPFRTSCEDPWFAFAPLFAREDERARLSFSNSCQQQNLSQVIIPFETVCEHDGSSV